MSHLNFRSKRRLFWAIFKHFVVQGKYKKCQAPLVVSAMKGPTLMGFFSIKMKKGKEVILSPFSRPILYSFYRFTFEEYEGSSTVGIKGKWTFFIFFIQCENHFHCILQAWNPRLWIEVIVACILHPMYVQNEDKYNWTKLPKPTYTKRWKSYFTKSYIDDEDKIFWTTKSIPFLPHLLMTEYRTKTIIEWNEKKKKSKKNLLKI